MARRALVIAALALLAGAIGWGRHPAIKAFRVYSVDADEPDVAAVYGRAQGVHQAPVLVVVEAPFARRKTRTLAPAWPKTSSSMSRPRSSLNHL